jgi:hypothetical protein
MPALGAGIHVLCASSEDVDGRAKPGHDASLRFGINAPCATSLSSVSCFTFVPARPSYAGEVTERSVMVVGVLPSPAWAFPPSTWPRWLPPARPFSQRQAAVSVGANLLSPSWPGLSPQVGPDLRHSIVRNSGKPELRCHPRLCPGMRADKTWMPAPSAGMTAHGPAHSVKKSRAGQAGARHLACGEFL